MPACACPTSFLNPNFLMATASPLPPDWHKVLEKIQTTLNQALQAAEAREQALAEQTIPPPPPREPSNEQFDELERRAQRAQAPLTDLDCTLQKEEDHVRGHLANITDLRQRLADWAGRLIG